MAALVYTPPGPMFHRAILAPFDDDPDWNVTTTAAPVDETWTMGRGITVPSHAVLTFAFFGADNLEVAGGVADVYEFYVTPRVAFGYPLDSVLRPVVRQGAVVAGLVLTAAYVATVVGPQPHGLRLSRIMAPGGAVVLKIAVQERPR